jgi:hypothetical protein
MSAGQESPSDENSNNVLVLRYVFILDHKFEKYMLDIKSPHIRDAIAKAIKGS